MVYLIRESRHCGLSLALDSVRFFSIDIDIRSLTDYLILKAQGIHGLTKDLAFLYAFVEPHLVRKLKPQQFLLVSQRGGIGYGVFPFHEWHKREREDILRNVGIKIGYGEALEQPVTKGTYKTVGDKEHVEIIKLYVEDALSMMKIADKLGRSSGTPHKHITLHNKAIARSGFCSSCKRARAKYYNILAERNVI